MVRVLLVEDELILCQEIDEYLKHNGYDVVAAYSLDEARGFSPTFKPDLIIIDINLPDGSGRDYLAEIRNSSIISPGIVIITGDNNESQPLKCLNEGADYYLSKPFRLAELEAVINAVSRRLPEVNGNKKQWILDLREWKLYAPEATDGLSLSAQDVIILRTLVQGCGNVVTRRQLVAALGKDYFDYDQRRMDTQMRRLRKKAINAWDIDLPVKTVHAHGYTFVAEAQIKR